MKCPTPSVALALPIAFALACGCSDKNGEPAAGISIMAEVGKIAPQFAVDDADSDLLPLPGNGDADFEDDPPGSVLLVVQEFLRFACHSSDGSVDVCADYGIEIDGDYQDSQYGMSNENFMGMVSGFGSVFDEVFANPEGVAACERFEGTAKAPEFTGSTQFLLGATGGFAEALDCVAVTQYGDSAVDTFFAYSADPASAAFVTTGLDDPGRGSYIYQGYARRDEAGQSSTVAMSSPVFNQNGSAQIMVFIGNLTNHRIVLKWIGFAAGGEYFKSVSAIGVGGITADGLVEGYYGLRAERFNDDVPLEAATVCVDNGTRSIVPAADALDRCSDPIIAAWLDGESEWEDVVAYLGLTAQDQAVLDADWGTLLATGAALTADDVPWDDSELISSID